MEQHADPDHRTLDRLEGELADVDRALGRLDEGTYAACEACGGAIEPDRLASSPTTRRCGRHDGPSPAPGGAPATPGR